LFVRGEINLQNISEYVGTLLLLENLLQTQVISFIPHQKIKRNRYQIKYRQFISPQMQRDRSPRTPFLKRMIVQVNLHIGHFRINSYPPAIADMPTEEFIYSSYELPCYDPYPLPTLTVHMHPRLHYRNASGGI
jgi:hypothetical protein